MTSTRMMTKDLVPAAKVEVRSRVLAKVLAARPKKDAGYLDTVLNDVLYHERKRLEKEKPKVRRAEEPLWESVHRAILRGSEADKKKTLEMLIAGYVDEVICSFDPRVYQLATRALPTGLSLLLNGLSPKRLLAEFPKPPSMAGHVVIQGHVDALRKLQEKGTIIFTPTHVSHIDSPAVGYMLYLAELPPFTYGAGKNLFTNPVFSFFMRNLGAYTVDRKKVHVLYKEVLKEYAVYTLELGFNNLFFPAGTRSRSGGIEGKLKLGLLGTGLSAYQRNLARGKEKPNIYVVPATLSYHLVLEAKTLIEDYLSEAGKSRYIIEDDEATQLDRLFRFIRNVVSLDAKIVISVGRPLDPFGNEVDEEGISHDTRGRSIDIRKYVCSKGAVVRDEQRDKEFTCELGRKIVESFRVENTALSTHVLAYALFSLWVEHNPEMDLYRLLHTGGNEDNVSLDEVLPRVDLVWGRLKKLVDGGKAHMGRTVSKGNAEDIIVSALRYFATYHKEPVVVRRGVRLFVRDFHLLHYYRNRLTGYGLLPESEDRIS